MKYEGSKTNTKGISFIELILVVAIVAIVAAASIPVGANFLTRNTLSDKTNELVSSLRTAQINAMSGKEDSYWGVYFDSSQITLFKGNSFSTRDSSFDQTFDVPQSVSMNQDEVVFRKLDGVPDKTISIILNSNSGDSTTVSVNEVGIIDVN